MRRSYVKAIALWLTTFVYVVGAVHPRDGIVLCIGPKNHVAVEVGGTGTCGCRLASATPDAISSVSNPPCQDIPLLEAGGRPEDPRSIGLNALPGVSAPLRIVNVAIPLLQKASPPMLDRRIGLALHLRSHRSVALLV